MSAVLVAQETIRIGEAIVMEAPAPNSQFGAVFEDDGETGYFYALDFQRQDNPILDARHIYNVDNVEDKDEPAVIEILWSQDGLKAVLLINQLAHAAIHFGESRSCCRTGFPPATANWGTTVTWDDKVIEWFQ